MSISTHLDPIIAVAADQDSSRVPGKRPGKNKFICCGALADDIPIAVANINDAIDHGFSRQLTKVLQTAFSGRVSLRSPKKPPITQNFPSARPFEARMLQSPDAVATDLRVREKAIGMSIVVQSSPSFSASSMSCLRCIRILLHSASCVIPSPRLYCLTVLLLFCSRGPQSPIHLINEFIGWIYC